MKFNAPLLRQSVTPKQKFTLRTLVICSIVFFAVAGSLFVYFNIGTSKTAKATTVAPSFVFANPSVYSGTAGNVNCVYKFGSVLNGIDAYITILDINNGASLANVDISQSTTGYENAFQPYVNFKTGSAVSPQTSYIEWHIEFKKSGTLTDTVISAVSVTAIDVDGNANIQESVSAPRPSSYSVHPATLLNITQNATTLTSVAPTTDFGGIDSSNRTVMFQMNFTNINDFVYRTMAINKSSSSSRQFSIYFQTFFTFSPLPVELIKFTAAIQDNSSVNLVWTTASEINNDFFTIEHSPDGKTFKPIGKIKGTGTTSQSQTYSFLHRQMQSGINYYRLVQTDFNGKTETFKPIVVQNQTMQAGFELTNVYPNPFKNVLNIYYRVQSIVPIKIMLLNAAGQQVKIQTENAVEGTSITSLPGLDALPTGQYTLIVTDDSKTIHTRKVIKK